MKWKLTSICFGTITVFIILPGILFTSHCIKQLSIKQMSYKNFKQMKVLILCTGNSCRSQMAHGLLQSFDSRIEVHSAGTEPAIRVNPLAVKAMRDIGIDIRDHTPHLVDEFLEEAWDYVITVCDHAHETCPAFLGKVTHRLHIGFEDPSHAVGNDEFIWSEYIRVRDEIKEGFWKLYSEEIKPQL